MIIGQEITDNCSGCTVTFLTLSPCYLFTLSFPQQSLYQPLQIGQQLFMVR